MDSKGLRNHAKNILRAVALDMRSSQTELQKIDKSHGLGAFVDQESGPESHALTRLIGALR